MPFFQKPPQPGHQPSSPAPAPEPTSEPTPAPLGQTPTPSPLPAGSATASPTLRAEVVARLHAYRREMMRRAYLLLGIFVVGMAGLALAGWWLFTNLAYGWGHFAFLAGFGVFLIGMMAGFLWLVYFAPLEKFGLRCGGCRTSFLEMDPDTLIRRGQCGICGQWLIRDAPDLDGEVIPVDARRVSMEEDGA